MIFSVRRYPKDIFPHTSAMAVLGNTILSPHNHKAAYYEGLSKELFRQFVQRESKTVIPSQCAHWRGNPFSLKNATNLNISGWETDCHTSDIGHWFAMTVLLFVQFYFSETDPYPYFLKYFAVRTGTGVFPASARIQKPMPMSPARARLIML